MNIEARWYQQESVDAVWNHLCTQSGNPVVVLPTGAGKSWVIAMLCRDAIEKFDGRVIVLAHRKELLSQNAEKIRHFVQDVGLHSAGLNRKQINETVIVGGIASVYRKAPEFGTRQLVIVDESHLIGSDSESMYQQFFTDMRTVNPSLRVVGLTATPFRTGEGRICRPDALFQKICYSAPIKRLIEEGFLSRLETTPVTNFDTSKLHVRGGEFIQSEMTQLFDDDKKIELSCKEILNLTADRRSLLVFCPGVFHAAKTSKIIEEMTGEECGLVTGETSAMERAATLGRFKSGSLKRLTNVDVLTTGFDSPNIDAIAVLRATMSPGLFAQMVGRGLRTAPEKQSCLVLDFGENLKRFGPIDSDAFGHQSRGGGKGNGDAPVKRCPACEEECPISATFCPCGFKFPERTLVKHQTNPDGSPILESDIKPTRWIVEEVFVARHKKKNGTLEDPDTLRVSYSCLPEDHTGGNLERKTISEWVCIEHEGFARSKAALWWSARSNANVPNTIDEAIDLWNRGALAAPHHMTTKPQGKFVRIVSVDLDDKPDSWRDPEEVVTVDAFDDVDLPF